MKSEERAGASAGGHARALNGLRVLDLARGGVQICGKFLGDLGADVIRIEPPGGDTLSRIAPFYRDIPDRQKSLFWFAYNTSKRGITLDIESADGQRIFQRLATTADLVIESFDPGHLDSLGIGYSALHACNPGIILTSVTPFGQSGPKAGYKGCDLIGWASTDGLFASGETDRRPVSISYPQPTLHAGLDACLGSLIAYRQRVMTGQGQHVDVSVQAGFCWSVEMAHLQMYEVTGYVYARAGNMRRFPTGVGRRQLFPCKDGYVAFEVFGGVSNIVSSTRAMVRWMAEESQAPEWLVHYDWARDFDTSIVTQEEVNRVEEAFEKFLLTKSKKELFDAARLRGIILAPVNNAEDIWKSEHLRSRNFWIDVEHDELGDTLAYAGLFQSFSETPGRITRRAPQIGEHNQEIYGGEMGLSAAELTALTAAGVI